MKKRRKFGATGETVKAIGTNAKQITMEKGKPITLNKLGKTKEK